MKLTNAILVLAVTSGAVWAQSTATAPSAMSPSNTAQQKQNASVKPAVAAVPAKPATSTPAAKPAVVVVKANASQPAAKPSAATASKAPMSSAAAQPKAVASKPVAVKPAIVKAVAVVPAAKKPAPVKVVKVKVAESKPSAPAASNVSVEKAPEPVKNEKTKTITANGRRDPFVSPVVSQSAVGSGCSVGKRCLAVDQISLKGVVKSETGMIAVVVNAVDKAYFLRENDPVFDGYVMKITGDSIVFKETLQDKLGKSFTKEVTKKISAPAV